MNLENDEQINSFYIDSQHKVFEHMIGKGIPVPEVVQNVNGATWSFEMIPSDQNPSRK